VQRCFETGVRAIDTLLTVGEGQRLGIFAAAGGGKSTLLGMLARRSAADVNVIALIGERGREIQEFIADSLHGDLSRSVLVVSTSDTSALARARGVNTATTIAEYFRDQGKRVLLLVDSVTRYARALRDVGLTAGEPPTRRGFPPSVFSTLPQVLERAGNSAKGSITAFYTVLVEDEESADPVAEEVRSILDGHLVLSRKLASSNHYPAIDVLHSVSRVMDRIVSAEHRQAAGTARRLLAKHRDLEVLLQMGEYEPGADAQADAAIACSPGINAHLRQQVEEGTSLAQSIASLQRAISAPAVTQQVQTSR
jgi:type III secretion protein N (ATPase)